MCRGKSLDQNIKDLNYTRCHINVQKGRDPFMSSLFHRSFFIVLYKLFGPEWIETTYKYEIM